MFTVIDQILPGVVILEGNPDGELTISNGLAEVNKSNELRYNKYLLLVSKEKEVDLSDIKVYYSHPANSHIQFNY